MSNEIDSVDVAIIGGGIAGLVAANYAARAGRKVALFERSEQPGGRARTTSHEGFSFNFGAHALYAAGANAAVLSELGIELAGGTPEASRYRALRGGDLHLLPTSGPSLVRTRLLGPVAKADLGRALASLAHLNPASIDNVALREWLGQQFATDSARDVFAAVARLASYANAPERVSAGAVVRQLQVGGAGVRYLDGGWQRMVNALHDRAVEAGATIERARPVRRVILEGGGATGIQLDGGRVVRAGAVIIATPPREAAHVAAVPALDHWSRSAVPVRAAVLDVALSRLPNPATVFSLGIDRPTYFSVHSTWAKLGPQGQHLVHVMKYLSPAADDPRGDRQELDDLLEFSQPGWRAFAVYERFLPEMVVAGWLPTAESGGLAGRPSTAVPGLRNLFVAGDWVGAEGMLSDAAFASGKRAGTLAASSTMRELAPA